MSQACSSPGIDWQSIPEELRGAAQHTWESLRDPDTKRLVQQHPDVIGSLPRVWGCSEFVARSCVAQPNILRELIESGDLTRAYAPRELHQQMAGQHFETEDELMQQLRQLRLREAVRIAWRDLAGWSDLDEVIAALSQLADACIDCALIHAYRWNCASRGRPLGATGGEPIELTVLGLGKLGGSELNFSSDVDLIFAYAEEGETDGERPISNHEFFVKLGRQLIRILDQPTADGFVFRVDMRLRPNGDSGPLALSFDATEYYYQTHGRDWERYALIKARVVAGDVTGGRQLLARLQPFVYRKYLDYGAFEAIRSMKDMISRELERKGRSVHVKLGRGGIREIEFIAQSFQLIRGGRDRALQTNRLFPALAALAQVGALSASAVMQLSEAYVFLRNLEHRLQMISDQQTHLLPADVTDRIRITTALGIATWNEFTETFAAITNGVHTQFQGIFAERNRRDDQTGLTALRDLWLRPDDGAQAVATLSRAGYPQPEESWQQLRALRQSKLYHAHSKYGRERLDRLMPMLIESAAATADPGATLGRLVRFIEAVGRRSAYLVLLIENPQALDQLVKLCAASEWISNWIGRYPLLLDELLDPILAQHKTSDEEVARELDYRLRQIDGGDLESQMEALREVRHASVLQVAAADVSGLIDWTEVGRRLCDIATTVLQAVIDLAREALQPRFGAPAGDGDVPPAFGIVAYGKLGGGELGYNSDLDLVFLHDGAQAQQLTSGGARNIPNEQYYGRLVQRMVHMITTQTPTGALYEIDMRLRPSGRAGPLVTSLDAYDAYQQQSAWTWEHQALVRARLICGPERLHTRFEQVRSAILTRERDSEQLRQDIAAMRGKMMAANDQSDDSQFDIKQGRGGIIDIEFIVQYYVLLRARADAAVVAPRGSIALIDVLAGSGAIDSEVAAGLKSAYDALLTMDHRLKLADKPPVVPTGELVPERGFVAALWGRIFD